MSQQQSAPPKRAFHGTLRLPVKTPAPPPSAGTSMTPDQKIALRVADLAMLREQFPLAFDVRNPRPLAIGIAKEVARLTTRKRAERLLTWWTVQHGYRAALAAGGYRINLDGSQAGEITEAQMAAAAKPFVWDPPAKVPAPAKPRHPKTEKKHAGHQKAKRLSPKPRR